MLQLTGLLLHRRGMTLTRLQTHRKICMKATRRHTRKSSTAMQMRGKWIQIRLEVKRLRKQQGSLVGGCGTRRRLPLLGLRGLSTFTTTAPANRWGRTDRELRRVETAPKTIVLCEGEELGRGLHGQRVFTAEQPCSAAVSTSVCIPCHTCSFNSA